MKKNLIVKPSARPSVDEVTIEKENSKEIRMGIINVNHFHKKRKQKFKNNSNKVLMKKGRR